jgi:hypothetical protein
MKLSSQFSFIRKSSQPPADAGGAQTRQRDSAFSLTREGALGPEAKSRHVPNVFQRLFKGGSSTSPSRAPSQPSQASQSKRSSFTMPRRIEPSKSTSSNLQDSSDGNGASVWPGTPVKVEKSSRQDAAIAIGNHVSAEQKMAHSQTHSESQYPTTIIHSLNALSQRRQSSAADSDRTMIRHSSFSQDSGGAVSSVSRSDYDGDDEFSRMSSIFSSR